MPRPKSPECEYIENKLKENPNLRFNDLVKFDDYTFSIENNFFNTVKSRFKRCALEAVFENKLLPASSDYEYSEEMQKLIPSLDPYFAQTKNFDTIISLVGNLSRIDNVNIRLVGPAGCGKTSFAMQYAAKNQLPCLVMDCANVREPRDWFGYRKLDPVTKDIIWHESLFVRVLETPHSVIILDEINRVSPLIINTLIPLMDHRRCTYLEEAQKQISCAEGVTFWASINEGSQFTGTIPLDEAVADRFNLVVECKFLPADEEKTVLHKKTGLDLITCEKLVDVANQVRIKSQTDGTDSFSKPISTRMLESAARSFKAGGAKTLPFTLLNHFSDFGSGHGERASLRQLLVGKFGSID